MVDGVSPSAAAPPHWSFATMKPTRILPLSLCALTMGPVVAQRYIAVLKEFDAGAGPDAPSLDLTPSEKQKTLAALDAAS